MLYPSVIYKKAEDADDSFKENSRHKRLDTKLSQHAMPFGSWQGTSTSLHAFIIFVFTILNPCESKLIFSPQMPDDKFNGNLSAKIQYHVANVCRSYKMLICHCHITYQNETRLKDNILVAKWIIIELCRRVYLNDELVSSLNKFDCLSHVCTGFIYF